MTHRVLNMHKAKSIITMRELRHWLSIAGMLPQSHCVNKEDGFIGLPS